MLGFEKAEWVATCLIQTPVTLLAFFPRYSVLFQTDEGPFLSSIVQTNLLFFVILDVWRKSGKILDYT